MNTEHLTVANPNEKPGYWPAIDRQEDAMEAMHSLRKKQRRQRLLDLACDTACLASFAALAWRLVCWWPF